MNWKISNTRKYWEYSPMIASKKHITAKSKYPFLFCIHNRTIYTKWEVDVKSSRDNRNYCRTKSKKSLILIYSSQRDRICVFIRWSEILLFVLCIVFQLYIFDIEISQIEIILMTSFQNSNIWIWSKIQKTSIFSNWHNFSKSY